MALLRPAADDAQKKTAHAAEQDRPDVLKQRWGIWPQAIEFEWNADKGQISGGTTVPYDQPSGSSESAGAGGFDEFIEKGKKGRGKGAKKGGAGG